MSTIVLRLYGSNLALDDCLAWIPKPMLAATWRIGEVGRRGKIHATSGVTILLSEGGELATSIAESMANLREIGSRVRATIEQGSSGVLDIGLFLGEEEKVTRSVTLDKRALIMIGEMGIELSVSAYPCSD